MARRKTKTIAAAALDRLLGDVSSQSGRLAPEDASTAARQLLETCQVTAEVGAFLQKDVEGKEVEALEREVFRSWVVGIGDQLVGVLAAYDFHQPTKGVGDHAASVPAQHICRDLVS